MKKYKVEMHYPDGSVILEEELYDTEEEAEDAGLYLVGCFDLGGEVLNMSNPGDYPLNENDQAEFEIIEVDV